MFGDSLRALRKRALLTQAELGEAVGYSPGHINALELSQRAPDTEPLVSMFVPALGLQTEHDLASRLLASAEALRGEHRIVVRVDPAPVCDPYDGWIPALSPDARRLAALLAMLPYPVDTRSAIVSEALGEPIDVRAAGRDLLQQHAIVSSTEAQLSPVGRDQLMAQLNPDEQIAARQAAARVSELLNNDFVGAARQLLAIEDVSAVVEVFFDRVELLGARTEAGAALQVLDEALKISRRQQQPGSVLFKLHAVRAELLVYLNQEVEAERSLREALTMARPAERRARSAMILAQMMLRRGQASEALDLTHQALEALTALDTLLLCRTSAIQSQALAQMAQADAAAEKAERALWLADALAHVSPALGDDARAIADNVLGLADKQRGHTQLALYHFERAAAAAARIRSRYQLCVAKVNAAYLLLELGMPDVAEASVITAQQLARELGDGKLAARMNYMLGMIHYYAGRYEQAEKSTLESIELRKRVGDQPGLVASFIQLVRIQAESDTARAFDTVRMLEEETRHGVDAIWRAGVLDAVAWIDMARGELAAAHTAFDELHRMLVVMKHPVLGATVRNHEALFALLRGLPIEALRLVSTPCPTQAGRDAEWERQFIEALATLALGNASAGTKLLSRIEQMANVDGYGRHSQMARYARESLAATPTATAARLYFGASKARRVAVAA